ncbi:MAG TPA: hemolysin family protein [Thermoanaerobaculia bacterium]|nr:hemolysin family protein [Thermoanaerobaculia bacterium]
MPDPQPLLSPATLGWIVGLLLPASVLVAVLSALLERSGPIRLRHWAEEAEGSLLRLFESPLRFGVFRFLLSLGGRLLPLCLYIALAALLRDLGVMRPAAWAFGVLLVIVGGTEAGNRFLVAHDPERALRVLTRAYRISLFVLAPLVTLLAPLVPARAFERPQEENGDGRAGEASEEEIEAFIDVGTREGILEPEEGEWLWSIVGFGDTQVRSVMTPRIDMVCASVDIGLDALAERFIESGHSRLPIYEDSIDHVIGILHIRDVLRALRAPEPTPVRELLKPALFIPETKPLGELLKELQARFQQVAIVVDEYGGTAGLVTVEDLVEEIVGEIMDEHEALVAELEPLENGGYRLEGRAHIELLDELFQIEIEDEEPEYETVAGLIFSELGYVPQPGETVESHGLRFTVEAVENRRIQTVRVEKITPDESETGDEEG